MSTIRRQSLISSMVVYVGFAIGFLNTYLFTRQGGFTKEQFGLTAIFVAVAQLMYSLSSAAMPAFVTKFFPYYKAHLSPKNNDLLTIALVVPCIGFLPVIVLGLLFKETLVSNVFDNSPELLQYYYWLFPFGFGYTIFMVLDMYTWQLQKAVLSNILKEVMFRAFVTVLIVLTMFGIINSFSMFIGLYAFVYVGLMLFLFVYLALQGHLHFTFQVSKVTRRFKKKIKALVTFVWSGSLIFSLSSVIDTLFIAAILPNGIGAAGVFTFGQYMTSLIQAPQRAVISAATGPLSAAWREKDYGRIQRIYQRSSINQLLFSCAMFSLIWINFEDGIATFQLQPAYLQAKWVFFYFGLTRIIDMGTGVNSQIIGTSSFWRFEFISGLVLLGLMLPLNFFLTRTLGMYGPALANLISFTVYNVIRFLFLYRKFGMQPFTRKTIYALVLAGVCFLLAYLPFREKTGLQWLFIRSLVFLVPFVFFTLKLSLSADVVPVWETLKKRMKMA
ncbi:MAG TPA: polysaccharide biosynthesis C-terminal domain-containing protein [Flavisolibacter sp.]|jgi:O-antigen/teichoic acid export membrane protein|nr:polysaccharide biosynthesis C-terminal domain-containing protein [Flavisolibacter sp.]